MAARRAQWRTTATYGRRQAHEIDSVDSRERFFDRLDHRVGFSVFAQEKLHNCAADRLIPFGASLRHHTRHGARRVKEALRTEFQNVALKEAQL